MDFLIPNIAPKTIRLSRCTATVNSRPCKIIQKTYRVVNGKTYCTPHFKVVFTKTRYIRLPTELLVIIMTYYVRYCAESRKNYNILNIALCDKRMYAIFNEYKVDMLRWIPIWISSREIPLKSLLRVCNYRSGTITTQKNKCDKNICMLRTSGCFNLDRIDFNPFDMIHWSFGRNYPLLKNVLNNGMFDLISTEIIDIHLYDLCQYFRTRTLVIEFVNNKILCLVMSKTETYALFSEFYSLYKPEQYYGYCAHSGCVIDRESISIGGKDYSVCTRKNELQLSNCLRINIVNPITPHTKLDIKCVNAYDISNVINILAKTKLCNI